MPRPGELQNARWDEVDVSKAVWIIPADRTKSLREHQIPLAAQSIAVFQELRELTGWGDLMLPSLRSPKRPISENTLNQALRKLGFSKDEMTAHGFRTTFSRLANESGPLNPDAIERSLAHVEQNEVRRAYARGAYWDERVRLSAGWAGEIDQMRTEG
ncbi:MAG: site-specific integrase [Pseudomonadota bacterium]